MKYSIGSLKIDELVAYFREGKIGLIPPFQRGRVWSLKLRQKLMVNMVAGKPIPAIFLYKEAASEESSQFTYNILDGKQRLESLLLFIGDQRTDLRIGNWESYFFQGHEDANFPILFSDSTDTKPVEKTFAELDPSLIREFREYKISTIEIEIDPDNEEGSFDEIISLFIDINSYGVRVNRFDIIRTMKDNNKLLSDTFDLIAQKQKRKKDYFFKTLESNYANVLKRLNTVQALKGRQQQVDRVWERMLEIVLFIRTEKHRTTAQILKGFMGQKVDKAGINKPESIALTKLFNTLKSVFAPKHMKKSQLATNQTHLYTLITSLHSLQLEDHYGRDELKRKLEAFAKMIDDPSLAPKGIGKTVRDYLALSSQKTTHPGRRADRQRLFARILEVI
jgi:hypothetical protein